MEQQENVVSKSRMVAFEPCFREYVSERTYLQLKECITLEQSQMYVEQTNYSFWAPRMPKPG